MTGLGNDKVIGSRDDSAEREKKEVALSSVIAAVFLTVMKLAVGLLTNSLGILSEAAHSGLDLVAAGITYLAVRVSDQPPDAEHPYGHGKVENLSALIETMLLLLTCVWIVYEAINRLIKPVHVEATFWAFTVMGISIVVDFSRSRALKRVAKKHNSQALEADALHFSTDIWSSSVVIVGLLALRIAQSFPDLPTEYIRWLNNADAIAALAVSAIVVYVSVRLGRRTINILLDTADKEMANQIAEAVEGIPGVLGVHQLRVRHGGPSNFVDMSLSIPRNNSLEEAHEIATQVEEVVRQLFPRTDVMVQISPGIKDEHSLVEQVRSVVDRHGLRVHGIQAINGWGQLSLEMHIEVPEYLTLNEAHELVTQTEDFLRQEITNLSDVVTHIEPMGDDVTYSPAFRLSSAKVYEVIEKMSEKMAAVHDCHSVKVHSDGSELSVSFHCLVDSDLSVSEAHQQAVELEGLIRAEMPSLGRVVIHTEPYEV
jgi:cation diffusion facilitator family transporter